MTADLVACSPLRALKAPHFALLYGGEKET
jgi:hypothetical protein